MKNIIFVFVVIFLFPGLWGCAQEPIQQKLIKSMEELDRRYIPAFVFINLYKQKEAEVAMGQLKDEWGKFYQQYYNLEIKYGRDITDKFWREEFDRVDSLLTSAEAMVKGEWLKDAYQQLREMRLVLKEIRRRNGLDYSLDELADFHEALEKMLSFLRGKNRLRDWDINELRKLFKQAQAALAAAEKAKIQFGFDAEKVDAIRQRIEEEQRLLAGFAAALSSGKADLIFQSAQELKPNFMVLYKAFGDFQPIFDRIIKERKDKEEGKNDKADH